MRNCGFFIARLGPTEACGAYRSYCCASCESVTAFSQNANTIERMDTNTALGTAEETATPISESPSTHSDKPGGNNRGGRGNNRGGGRKNNNNGKGAGRQSKGGRNSDRGNGRNNNVNTNQSGNGNGRANNARTVAVGTRRPTLHIAVLPPASLSGNLLFPSTWRGRRWRTTASPVQLVDARRQLHLLVSSVRA